VKKLLILVLFSNYSFSYIGCANDVCTEFYITKNKHGVVLKSTGEQFKFKSYAMPPVKLKNAKRIKKEILYIGRKCDSYSKIYGKGNWYQKNAGFFINFANKSFFFPKQEIDIKAIRPCRENDSIQQKKSKQSHPSLKGLVQGMNYSKARRVLLKNGWQASYRRWQDIPEFGREHKYYFDKGWREVESCSGTGMGYCMFKFHDHYGNKLDVVTEGDNPIVSHWSLKFK